jgi:hypothetical protein
LLLAVVLQWVVGRRFCHRVGGAFLLPFLKKMSSCLSSVAQDLVLRFGFFRI